MTPIKKLEGLLLPVIHGNGTEPFWTAVSAAGIELRLVQSGAKDRSFNTKVTGRLVNIHISMSLV